MMSGWRSWMRRKPTNYFFCLLFSSLSHFFFSSSTPGEKRRFIHTSRSSSLSIQSKKSSTSVLFRRNDLAWEWRKQAKVKYYHQALIAKRLNRFPLYMACVFILWCKHNGIFGRCWMESTQKAKVPSSSSSFLQWITLLFFSVFRERFSLSLPFRRTARFHHHIHPKKEQRHKTFAFRFCAVLSGKHFN